MGLKDIRKDMYIGAAVSPKWLENETYAETVKNEFSSVTCENEMKPQFTMDREATLEGSDNDRVKLNFAEADKVLSFARDNGIKVRAHVLIWHNQTPRWFFAENWSDAEDAPLVNKDTLIRRMENYIRDEMEYINKTYPDLVYCWDVLNEFIEPDNNHPRGCRVRKSNWFKVLGEETPLYAFSFARKYTDKDQKLFYNDYNEYEQPKRGFIIDMLKPIIEKGLIDGMGMQSHLLMDYPSIADYKAAINDYAALGLSLQVTELDVRNTDGSEAGQTALAKRYKEVFEAITQSGKVEGATLWGVTDAQSWLNKPDAPACSLLFDREGNKKPAYYAVSEALK